MSVSTLKEESLSKNVFLGAPKRMKLKLPDSLNKLNSLSIFDNIAMSMRLLVGCLMAVEGIIGAGKTTCGESLNCYLIKKGLRAKFFREQVNTDYLELYIGDMKNNAFGFQMNTLTRRAEIYTEALNFAKSGGNAILDRTLTGDVAFALMQKNKKTFSDVQWQVYSKTVNKIDVEPPSIIVYLETTATEAFDRMKERGNASETKGYTLKYFKDLKKVYDLVMTEVSTNNQVLRLDWSEKTVLVDKKLDDDVCVSLLQKIKSHLLKEGLFQTPHLKTVTLK